MSEETANEHTLSLQAAPARGSSDFMATNPTGPSPWRPSFKGRCDRRNFLRGYAVVATLAFGTWLLVFVAAAFGQLFSLFGVNASVVFVPIAFLAMMSWPPLLFLACFVYLPALVIRRARSIASLPAIACFAAILAAVWLRWPPEDLLVGKNPIVVVLHIVVDPVVALSTLSLYLPKTLTRVPE